jgi:hypothetical protein
MVLSNIFSTTLTKEDFGDKFVGMGDAGVKQGDKSK